MLNYLKDETNIAYTENGARAYATTKSSLLDFFAQGGAMRNRPESDIISAFTQAFAEDALLAMKMLFYFRDIRGGQGERRTVRTILKYMAQSHPEVILKNLHLIPVYGRWDDLYEFFGTKLEKQAGELIKTQFQADMKAEYPSLLGKWLKSVNATSRESVLLGVKTREILGLTPRQYRKALTSLRNKINVVEKLMTEKKWDAIEYDKLPSKAGLKYAKAFERNDSLRYHAFLESLKKGEKKINASTLYPYEIVHKARLGGDYSWSYDRAKENPDVLNALWEALPNYIGDKQENSIAVVDTSGSMSGQPIEVALSLGLYLAERNKGQFHNHFISFSNSPQLIELKGSNFCEKVYNMSSTGWGHGTNIEGVFDLILNTAIKHRISQDEMVGKIYIISDMEFDSATGYWSGGRNNKALFEVIADKYARANYKMPLLVFWNVNARNAQHPMTMDSRGVLMVSGHSPSVFTSLMKGDIVTPYDMMLDVLNSERYAEVTV